MREFRWRMDDEVPVITVTPVPQGVWRPVTSFVIVLVAIAVASARWHVVHRWAPWLLIVVCATLGVVALTRTWKWRSHKVHVTSKRVVLEGGVLRHWTSTIDLEDIHSIHVDQRVSDRLVRRGYVILDCASGSIPVGPVRHPSALARLIDAERTSDYDNEDVPLDAVFTYQEEQPRADFSLRVERPPQWSALPTSRRARFGRGSGTLKE